MAFEESKVHIVDQQMPAIRRCDVQMAAQAGTAPARPLKPDKSRQNADNGRDQKIILLGASTGGVDALLQILRHFSPFCPPTLIVQHTGGQFAASLIRLLDRATQATVCAAQDGAVPTMGHIYLSPSTEYHLRIATGTPLRIALCNSPARMGHRPAVDALFESALPFAPNITAALLTGMGKDGARGLLALRQAGARTLGQDEKTSIIYGMPRVAKTLGAVERELPISEIGPALLRTAMNRS